MIIIRNLGRSAMHHACRCRTLTPLASLPADSRAMLEALRQMVIAWPRSPLLDAMLIDRYGDQACGIQHLLRCLLTGIGMHARRRVRVGMPHMASISIDEAELLEAIGLDGAEPDPSALARIAGNPKAARLAPLGEALRAAVLAARVPAGDACQQV
jgi:hypothetical protein